MQISHVLNDKEHKAWLFLQKKKQPIINQRNKENIFLNIMCSKGAFDKLLRKLAV